MPDDPSDRPADVASPAKVERLAREYAADGRPFARVTVVRREPPVSATVGDRALVTPDGEIHGWVGGATCAQSVVVRAATAALDSGEPTLVGLAPDPDDVDRPGVEAFPMTCASGGTLELFVEPVLPNPRLVVVGDSPTALALARLAGELTYDVTVVGADPGDAPAVDRVLARADADAVAGALEAGGDAVVASMGAFDEAGLEGALRAGAPYVGLVASAPRAEDLFERLAPLLDRDPDDLADAVTTPAGLDIGARTPEAVAVSILAELVAVREGGDRRPAAEALPTATTDEAPTRGTTGDETPTTPGDETPTTPGDETPTTPDGETPATADEPSATTDAPETAVDPVCGMTVAVETAAGTVEHAGETFHFCGVGCAEAFEAEPGRYVGAVEGEP